MAIRLSDLRMGSWVNGTSDFEKYPMPLQVVALMNNKVYCRYAQEKEREFCFNQYGEANHYCNEVYPIYLSPEILTECCGFHKDNYGVFEFVRDNKEYKSGCKILFWTKKVEGKWDFCMGDDLSNLIEVSSIKYLHQLQNLHIIVTEAELEISFKNQLNNE